MTRRAPVLHALSWVSLILGFCLALPDGFLVLASAWFEDTAVAKEQALRDLELFPSPESR